MNIKGIIFDLDGTLADTEPLHMRAWLDVLADQGLDFDEHWFEQWIGFSDRHLADSVVQEYQLPVAASELQQIKSRTFQEVAARSARPYPRVEDGLERLKARFKLGLATNSSREDATAVFTSTKLNQHFQAVVTSSDVQRMKPAPDCYLLAASRIGLNPAEGVAVEDSVAGVRSAKSAGLYTLAVTNSHDAGALGDADRIFSDTLEAMDWVFGL